MIDLMHYPIFAQNLSTLKETSLDISMGQAKYMTQNTSSVINFDSVKNEYIRHMQLSESPKSCDALFQTKDALVLVEFKNGCLNKEKQFAVRKKIYDSLLIFTDITSCTISNTRNSMIYVLVYNESVNNTNTTDTELKQKHDAVVQPSISFNRFARALGEYAKEEYVCFGLTKFKKYCFKEVHTFTESEFDNYMASIIE